MIWLSSCWRLLWMWKWARMPFHGTLECLQHQTRQILCLVDAVMVSSHNRECQWMHTSNGYANNGSAFPVVQWDESGGERWRARFVPLRKKVMQLRGLFQSLHCFRDSVDVQFLRTCQWCSCAFVFWSVCVFLPLPVSLSLYPDVCMYICIHVHILLLYHDITRVMRFGETMVYERRLREWGSGLRRASRFWSMSIKIDK